MKLLITVKPKSRQERVEKTDSGYVAYVKEQPVDNKANRALIQLLSQYFGVPKSHIAIVSGLHSKQKVVEIKDFSDS
ncbi:MAG: DUF167 domain-containing protein [Candidatus Tectomicrobia bacterium]|nr:DUF167 domain-containing protein [Candidatus Tectomicrobia bacterium]